MNGQLFDLSEPGFDQFWSLYPKKRNKRTAQRAWAKLSNDERQASIQDVAERKHKDSQWLKGFIPHPGTYLNAGAWEDEWEEETKLSFRERLHDTSWAE